VTAAIALVTLLAQTMVVVTHEIAFARQVAGRVAVLVDGRIVEEGAVHDVLEHPRHAETRAFLAREEGA
jgi:ABC-type polar amino acid transport system ATPase subunit